MTTESNHHFPENIVLEKWADIGFKWQGVIWAYDFERLKPQITENSQLDVQVLLYKDKGILWLDFVIAGVLMMNCQRCLSAMDMDVSGEYRVAILRDETQADYLDEVEFVLIDEICVGDGRKMLPLKTLLEDELLLALPLAPRHADCQMLIDTAGDDIADERADNPFAVLAGLKDKLS